MAFCYARPLRHPSLFVGRGYERGNLAGNSEPFAIFVGDRKIGKTSLLWCLESELPRVLGGENTACCVYVPLRRRGFTTAESVFQHIAESIRVHMQSKTELDDSILQAARSNSLSETLRLLDDASAAGIPIVLMLFVDDLEQFGRAGQEATLLYQGFRELLESVPSAIPFVFAATSTTRFLSSESFLNSTLLSRLEPPVYLGPWRRDEASQFLDVVAAPAFGFPVDEETRDLLEVGTGWHPYLTQKALSQVAASKPSASELPHLTETALDQLSRSESHVYRQWLAGLTTWDQRLCAAIETHDRVSTCDFPNVAFDRVQSTGIALVDSGSGIVQSRCSVFFQWRRQVRGDEARQREEDESPNDLPVLAAALRSHLESADTPDDVDELAAEVKACLVSGGYSSSLVDVGTEASKVLRAFRLSDPEIMVYVHFPTAESSDPALHGSVVKAGEKAIHVLATRNSDTIGEKLRELILQRSAEQSLMYLDLTGDVSEEMVWFPRRD